MQPDIEIPYNWQPREHQKKAMNAWLYDDIKLHDWIWHRRMGKDDCGLHGTSFKAHERVANYCIMLPQDNQVREALWEAVNPHTGVPRTEEAFPLSIRAKTNEQQMRITLKCGSKIVFAGSDNYKNKIGSSIAGIVYSEWALSDPASYAYLSPMLKENNGWCVRQGTPRGKNHAYKTYLSGLDDPNRFAQLLTARDTGMDKQLDMESIKFEYTDLYGEDEGTAMFLQEWYCSFDAPILGSIYGKEFAKVEQSGRITTVTHNPNYKVFTAWDIGRTDSTAIWFYQVIGDKVHFIDYEEASLQTPEYFFSLILGIKIEIVISKDRVNVVRGQTIEGYEHRQAYDYQSHFLPHDARARTFAATGKSLEDQAHEVFGWSQCEITPSLSILDGIGATRQMLKTCVFDENRCMTGVETIKQYTWKYNETTKVFSKIPLHNWASNCADALRYAAIAYRTRPEIKPVKPDPTPNDSDNGLVIQDYIKKRRKAEW